MWADFASVYVVIAQQLEIYYRRRVGSGGIFVFNEKKTERKKDSTLQLTVVVSCATVEFIPLLCDGENMLFNYLCWTFCQIQTPVGGS